MTFSAEFAKSWYKLNKEMKLHMDKELAPSLTESQFIVLEYLLNNPVSKPSDFVDYLATTPAAITTLLDRMERNGLIQRARDEQDRRIVWIQITDKGTEEGHRGLKIREQFLDQYLNKISQHNQQLLIYLLEKMLG
jgi:DNA-binding MarR family transcriptional regulator